MEATAAAKSTAGEESHWKEGRAKNWKKKSREEDPKQRTFHDANSMSLAFIVLEKLIELLGS
ncbi:hypothetical protein HN51_004824 [Arachis hypogaea]